MKNKDCIGQITTRKIGKLWVVCVSGDPVNICKNKSFAEKIANNLRIRHGRRPKRKKR